MYVNRIKLINFRNYQHLEVGFKKGINLLYGDNAQGKTNVIEAIHLGALGKSQRIARDAEMIFFGSQGYFIEIDLIKSERSYKIEIGVNNKKEKRIKLSGVEIKKIGELLGKLVIVLFSPDELRIIKESPYHRRRFLDILVCQLSASYLLNLQKYYKIAAQRNNLLKQIKLKRELIDTLDIWDIEYTQTAVLILKKRIEYFNKLKEKAQQIHYKLTNGNEILEISYKSTFKEFFDSTEHMSKNFAAALEKARKTDIDAGFSHIGPHRDDIVININSKDAGKFASQGQQRTAVLSLKLAELEVIKEEIGEYPILLLDDVFSELDMNRRKFLIEHIKDAQVFITSTEKLDDGCFIDNINYYRVNDGKIES
ncbi:MAG: DNA replication/repair protein RecF [Deltaproteobacteria bacterium]